MAPQQLYRDRIQILAFTAHIFPVAVGKRNHNLLSKACLWNRVSSWKLFWSFYLPAIGISFHFWNYDDFSNSENIYIYDKSKLWSSTCCYSNRCLIHDLVSHYIRPPTELTTVNLYFHWPALYFDFLLPTVDQSSWQISIGVDWWVLSLQHY